VAGDVYWEKKKKQQNLMTIEPQSFSLSPFPDDRNFPNIEICGTVSRQDNIFKIDYQLKGNLETIFISPSSHNPARRNELWQTTCLEFFLGIVEKECYWEFNLSPSGDWNIYRFDSYRRGMREEITFDRLPFTTQIQPNLYQLQLSVDLNKIIAPDILLDMAITAVIETKEGKISYWALSHRSSEADFHQRKSFDLVI
jgi:hypothetical protein